MPRPSGDDRIGRCGIVPRQREGRERRPRRDRHRGRLYRCPSIPRILEDVAAALLRECTARVPGVWLAGALTPVTGGFDTYIYFFGLAGDVPPEWSGPLVLRLYPGPEREDSAWRETAIQAFCADAGYPAPCPLTCGDNASSFGLAFMIMERAPGRTILAAISAQPWRAGALLDQLAGLQARLHALDPAAFPVAPVGPLVDRMLDLMDQEFSPGDKNIANGVDWLRHGAQSSPTKPARSRSVTTTSTH